MSAAAHLLGIALVAITPAIASYFCVGWAIEWLRSRAMARPNHRSGHADETPQGAGIVIIPIALTAIAGAVVLGAVPLGGLSHAISVAAAALGLMLVGFVDDSRPLPVTPRLAIQVMAAALVLFTLPVEFRFLPAIVPVAAERVLLFLAILWFTNVMNFMDGLDWMSAVETLSIGGGIVLLAALGLVPNTLGWYAAAISGALAGFMPRNAPPARVFLGDAGSLPLGLLLATMLLHLAAAGAHAAAMILPLYYLADATITLLRRIVQGAHPWEAHRDHYYQRAQQRGWPVLRIVTHVGLLNGALIALAVTATWIGTWGAGLIAFGLSLILVLATIHRFDAAERKAGGG